MSIKPKIYAKCDAGCKWETVHKEDFDKLIYLNKINVDTYPYELEVGKTYRLKYPAENYDDICFTIDFYFLNGIVKTLYIAPTTSNFDKYKLACEVTLLAVEHPTVNSVKVVYEVNGERTEYTYEESRLGIDITDVKLNLSQINDTVNPDDFTLYEKRTDVDVYSAITDDEMSDTSTNPVQNKVIKAYVDNRVKANPTEEASTTLTKLQIGDTIYNIDGGSKVNYKITNFTLTQGKYYLSNGKLYEAENYKATGYIDVSLLACTTITVKTQLHTPCCIVFFNENYGVITYTDSTGHDNAYYEYELDIPTGAQYLGVSMYDTTGTKKIEITVEDYFPDYIMLAGEKIEELKKSLPNESNLLSSKNVKLTEIDYTLQEGKYWSSNGKMLASANYYATDKIDVSNYRNKTLYVKTAIDSVSFIVFFDKYNRYLSKVANDGTDYKYYEVEVPSDAYFMGVTLKDTTAKLSIRIVADNVASAISQAGTQISEINDCFEITDYVVQDGCYYYSVNGSLQTNAGYYAVTIRADMFVGADMSIFTRLDNNIAGIVFLNSNKTKISAITDTVKTYKKYDVTVPENTKYIGISCFGTQEQYNMRIFVKEISNVFCKIGNILDNQESEYKSLSYNADGGDARIFTKWGAIGDSLSNGVLEYTDGTGTSQSIVDRSYSFIQYIGRKLGITAHNYSKGGTTAKEMYGLNQDSMYESKDQIYTLGFGTNDSGLQEYTGGWGTAADINTSDYTQNADSFVGYMARIIQKIRVGNPKAIFFLLTKPLAPQAEQLAAIQAVASVLDDVYVIDMTTYSTKVLSKYKVGAHCSIYGYKLMADYILNSIANTVNSNPAHFNDVFRIGTENIT